MFLEMTVNFVGTKGYSEHRGFLKYLVQSLTKDKDMNFYLGINEAVVNALMYGTLGPSKTRVCMRIRITPGYLAVGVTSKSPGFDVLKKREQLGRIAAQRTADWAELMEEEIHGRGIWMMLAGCSKVIYSHLGDCVVLITKIPGGHSEKRGSQLISRLFIERRGLDET